MFTFTNCTVVLTGAERNNFGSATLLRLEERLLCLVDFTSFSRTYWFIHILCTVYLVQRCYFEQKANYDGACWFRCHSFEWSSPTRSGEPDRNPYRRPALLAGSTMEQVGSATTEGIPNFQIIIGFFITTPMGLGWNLHWSAFVISESHLHFWEVNHLRIKGFVWTCHIKYLQKCLLVFFLQLPAVLKIRPFLPICILLLSLIWTRILPYQVLKTPTCLTGTVASVIVGVVPFNVMLTRSFKKLI
jgi:hypothetical protein